MAQVKESLNPNRHLRSEITSRWQLLSNSEVEESCVDRSKLISFLQNRYGFVRRRAEQEVQLFYLEFQQRLRLAA
jgi:hypothetical protein